MKFFTLHHLTEYIASAKALEAAAVWKLEGQKIPLPQAAERYLSECGIDPKDWYDVISNAHTPSFIRAWCLYNRGYDPHYRGHPCPLCGQEVPLKRKGSDAAQ